MRLHENRAIFLLKKGKREGTMKIRKAFKNYRRRMRILKTIRVLDKWRKESATYRMISLR